MKRNTATQLLKLLTQEELRKLSKFLQSPYFNYSTSIVTLFDCLRKWHPAYPDERIRPNLFWKKIYPDKAFSEQAYWKLNFKLRGLIEQFLAVEKLQGDEEEFKRQLIHSYADRNALPFLEKEIESFMGMIDDQPSSRSFHTYLSAFKLKYHYFFHPYTDRLGAVLYSVDDIMAELDRFYILAKLSLAVEIKNREKIFPKDNEILLLDEAKSISTDLDAENIAYLGYRLILNLYEPDQADQAYEAGKKYLEEYFPLLSREEQVTFMQHLRNYVIRQLNSGKDRFWSELFDLYKAGLLHGLIVENDAITADAFGNIVKTGCMAGEFEWTLAFINEYESKLEESLRADAKAISYGNYYFHKKDYEEIIHILSQHKFTGVIRQLNAKVMLIKAWFHQFLQDPELYFFIQSTIAADEKFIRRYSTLSPQRKEIHLNFFLAVKKLTELIMNKTEVPVIASKMNKFLSPSYPMVSKIWIKKFVEDLKAPSR